MIREEEKFINIATKKLSRMKQVEPIERILKNWQKRLRAEINLFNFEFILWSSN